MKIENEKTEIDRTEREKDRQFELEKLRLLKKTEVSPVISEFDAAKNIRLIPKFQEKAVDKYFLNLRKLLQT